MGIQKGAVTLRHLRATFCLEGRALRPLRNQEAEAQNDGGRKWRAQGCEKWHLWGLLEEGERFLLHCCSDGLRWGRAVLVPLSRLLLFLFLWRCGQLDACQLVFVQPAVVINVE